LTVKITLSPCICTPNVLVWRPSAPCFTIAGFAVRFCDNGSVLPSPSDSAVLVGWCENEGRMYAPYQFRTGRSYRAEKNSVASNLVGNRTPKKVCGAHLCLQRCARRSEFDGP
jgi:hypothetical protein